MKNTKCSVLTIVVVRTQVLLSPNAAAYRWQSYYVVSVSLKFLRFMRSQSKRHYFTFRGACLTRSRLFETILSLPYRSLDKTRHDGNSHTAAGHDEYLDELALAFEILRHHQSRTVPGHTDADS